MNHGNQKFSNIILQLLGGIITGTVGTSKANENHHRV